MNWVIGFVRSSLGAKFLMAISGLGLFTFIVGHLVGNALYFSGPQAINAYAFGLMNLPFSGIWIARVLIFTIFVSHIILGGYLTLKNSGARPERYAVRSTVSASIASRTMIYSGLTILAFLLWHLAHFTFRIVHSTDVGLDNLGRLNVHAMMTDGFSEQFIVLGYLAALVVLAFHMGHGVSSLFQTLGLNHKKYTSTINFLGPIVGWGTALALISIPASILFGLVG